MHLLLPSHVEEILVAEIRHLADSPRYSFVSPLDALLQPYYCTTVRKSEHRARRMLPNGGKQIKAITAPPSLARDPAHGLHARIVHSKAACSFLPSCVPILLRPRAQALRCSQQTGNTQECRCATGRFPFSKSLALDGKGACASPEFPRNGRTLGPSDTYWLEGGVVL